MMIDMNSVPSKTEGLMERSLNDEIVVLSSKGDVLHTFSGTARFIWSMIDGNRTIESIARAMTDEYEVDEETARSDLERFLGDLLSLSLIKTTTIK